MRFVKFQWFHKTFAGDNFLFSPQCVFQIPFAPFEKIQCGKVLKKSINPPGVLYCTAELTLLLQGIKVDEHYQPISYFLKRPENSDYYLAGSISQQIPTLQNSLLRLLARISATLFRPSGWSKCYSSAFIIQVQTVCVHAYSFSGSTGRLMLHCRANSTARS